MDPQIPMDEFERAFAAEDAPPRPPRIPRLRTVAILLLIVGFGSFAVDIVWIMLSHHEPSGLRLVSVVSAAVGVFLLQRFPSGRTSGRPPRA